MARRADSITPLPAPFAPAMTPKQTALMTLFSGLHDVEPDADDFDIRMVMWAEHVLHKVGAARTHAVLRLIRRAT